MSKYRLAILKEVADNVKSINFARIRYKMKA
jgi:hypothetical protein